MSHLPKTPQGLSTFSHLILCYMKKTTFSHSCKGSLLSRSEAGYCTCVSPGSLLKGCYLQTFNQLKLRLKKRQLLWLQTASILKIALCCLRVEMKQELQYTDLFDKCKKNPGLRVLISWIYNFEQRCIFFFLFCSKTQCSYDSRSSRSSK